MKPRLKSLALILIIRTLLCLAEAIRHLTNTIAVVEPIVTVEGKNK